MKHLKSMITPYSKVDRLNHQNTVTLTCTQLALCRTVFYSLLLLPLLHVSKSKRCLKTFHCPESNSSEMRNLRHNNPTSLQIFENILPVLDATLVKPFKKHPFLQRDKPPWTCRDLFNTINRLLIDR